MDSAHWDARYAESELVWSAEPNQWVAAELSALAPGSALDLAAGEGRNSIWLAGLGWHVLAVDFSPVALQKGRRLAEHTGDSRSERLTWLAADLMEFIPEAASVDLALICYLQVEAAQRTLVVGRAARALKPCGVLLVVGHDTANLTEGTGGPQDAGVLYTPADLVADLQASGVPVRVEKQQSVRRPVSGADRPAIDALVRAVRLS